MSTRHRIDNAVRNVPMGDVEKYFKEISNLIETNSGVHDCKMISHDCSNTSVPVRAGQFTRFRLTDQAMDIVDLSKGYIAMKLQMDVQFLFKQLRIDNYNGNHHNFNSIFFIGFKSGTHIIDVYNVYSNGVLTNCKQTKARHEQFITFASKSKEERAGRPGMYSTHEKVLEQSDCVCGAYIKLPEYNKMNEKMTITFEVIMQLDDLLPFSAMEYYPRFLTGDLELELAPTIVQNMVFCQLPITNSWNTRKGYFSQDGLSQDNCDAYSHACLVANTMDTRFYQCGDYIKEAVVSWINSDSSTPVKYTANYESLTIMPSNLVITEAKSYIHGFNIKTDAKQSIANMFGDKNLVIPAQWVDHYTFSQLPTTSSIRTNIQLSLNNACQAILTFPNSANQLTTSRNPQLQAVQCQISDRIIPDKFFSTIDKAHAEMIIENLNFDTLFTAPDELIEALTVDRGQCDEYNHAMKKDDSDYMLVFNLERFGNGCYCDGLSGQNIPINFQADFMYGTKNHHFYDYSFGSGITQRPPQNINLFIVSDAFWVCNRDGCKFIKDIATDM